MYERRKIHTPHRMKTRWAKTMNAGLWAILFTLLYSMLIHHPIAYADDQGYTAIVVVETTLNVRAEPGLTAEIIGSLQGGEKIDVMGEMDGWAEISYEERQAWIASDYIVMESEAGMEDKKDAAQTDLPSAPVPSSNADHRVIDVDFPVDELINSVYEMNNQLESSGTVAIGPSGSTAGRTEGDQGPEDKAPSSAHDEEVDSTEATDTMESSTPENAATETGKSEEITLGFVTADALRLRAEPNLNADIQTLLLYGTALHITDKTDDGWLQVVTPEDRTGWVSAEFVSITSIMSGANASGKDLNLQGKRIVIDPGHGGKDSGTIGVKHKTYEKILTLSTSLIVAAMLQEAGAEVILTRSHDVYLELSERVNISNQQKADLFISIHYDYGTKNSSGIISFYYSEARDRRLADTVQRQLTASTGMQDSGVRKGNFYVIRENNRPSLLLELGYVSNPDEEELVRTTDYQQKVAKGIVKGLSDYFALGR